MNKIRNLIFIFAVFIFTTSLVYADQVYNIQLKSGENLVVLPVTPKDKDIKVVLSPIMNRVKDVWEFNLDDTSDPWKHFCPGLEEYSDLKQMSDSKGYWINLKSDAVLQVTGKVPAQSPEIDLKQGWNEIIWPYASSLGITGGLYGLIYGVDYDQVSCFNNTTKTQEDFLNQPLNDTLKKFESNKVYYIHMLEEKELALGDPKINITPEIAGTNPQNKSTFYENDPINISCSITDSKASGVQYRFSIDEEVKQEWSQIHLSFGWNAVPGKHKIKIETKNTYGQDAKEVNVYIYREPIKRP